MYRPRPWAGACVFAEQARQLTEARRAEPWLAAGSVNVQQQCTSGIWARRGVISSAGTHRRPGFRKKDQHEGFRITDFTFALHVRKLNRRWSQVKVPKIGWVRFRRSRNVPGCKSYRITRDRAGRWHVAFAVVPPPVEGPGTGQVTGIDRGVSCVPGPGRWGDVPGPGRIAPGGTPGPPPVPGQTGQQPAAARQGPASQGTGTGRRPAERLGRESLYRHRPDGSTSFV